MRKKNSAASRPRNSFSLFHARSRSRIARTEDSSTFRLLVYVVTPLLIAIIGLSGALLSTLLNGREQSQLMNQETAPRIEFNYYLLPPVDVLESTELLSMLSQGASFSIATTGTGVNLATREELAPLELEQAYYCFSEPCLDVIEGTTDGEIRTLYLAVENRGTRAAENVTIMFFTSSEEEEEVQELVEVMRPGPGPSFSENIGGISGGQAILVPVSSVIVVGGPERPFSFLALAPGRIPDSLSFTTAGASAKETTLDIRRLSDVQVMTVIGDAFVQRGT